MSSANKIVHPFSSSHTKPKGKTEIDTIFNYDIIKAHGGEIKVETKENEGTEFIIKLPIKTNP